MAFEVVEAWQRVDPASIGAQGLVYKAVLSCGHPYFKIGQTLGALPTSIECGVCRETAKQVEANAGAAGGSVVG